MIQIFNPAPVLGSRFVTAVSYSDWHHLGHCLHSALAMILNIYVVSNGGVTGRLLFYYQRPTPPSLSIQNLNLNHEYKALGFVFTILDKRVAYLDIKNKNNSMITRFSAGWL